jgi:hypothetical protein
MFRVGREKKDGSEGVNGGTDGCFGPGFVSVWEFSQKDFGGLDVESGLVRVLVLVGNDGILFEGVQLSYGCKVCEELVKVLQRFTMLSNKFFVWLCADLSLYSTTLFLSCLVYGSRCLFDAGRYLVVLW